MASQAAEAWAPAAPGFALGIMALFGGSLRLSLMLIPLALVVIAALCHWRVKVGNLRFSSAMVGGLGGGIPLAFGTYQAVDYAVNTCIFDCGPPNTTLPLVAAMAAFFACGITAVTATALTPRSARQSEPLLPPGA